MIQIADAPQQSKCSEWPDISDLAPSKVTDHQAEQWSIATSGNIGILTGGPGTGKSHTFGAAMRLADSSKVLYAAPTGKAAVRMTESLHAGGVNGWATTIHTMLRPQRAGHDGGSWEFGHRQSNPLPCDLLIMDESSMVTTSLAASVFGAVRNGTKVLLIGDPYQLPPVGHGRPFLDMIESGIPHGHLTETHRFAGRIASICKAIHEGARWLPPSKVDLEAEFPENFLHIETGHALAQMNAIKETISRCRERGFDPVSDCQVLTPCNEKSPVSRKALNIELQKFLNPNGRTEGRNPFRVGDKVVCLSNGYYKARPIEEWDDDAVDSVSNGEIGIVIDVTQKDVDVKFEGHKLTTVFGVEEWKFLSLGYAITVHKSQGSGWPVVIPVCDSYAGARRVCSRSYHYTAFSRASKLCVSIGSKTLIDRDCRNIDTHRRKTFLTERIQRTLETL